MAYWGGPSHQMVQTLAAWIKTIEEASGGNLTVEVDKAAFGKIGGPIRPDQERRARSRLGGARLYRRPVRYAAGGRAAAAVPRPGRVQPDPVEVVRRSTASPPRNSPIPRCWPLSWAARFGMHTAKPARTLDEIRALKIRAAGPSLPVAKALGMNAGTAAGDRGVRGGAARHGRRRACFRGRR